MAELEVRVGPPVVVVDADDHFVVTGPDATIDPTRQQGFFASDTQYLGANTPQAWESGAPIQMISAFLGLEPDADAGTLRVTACLPEWLTSVRVNGLGVGKETVTLTARRQGSEEPEVWAEPRDDGLVVETHAARPTS